MRMFRGRVCAAIALLLVSSGPTVADELQQLRRDLDAMKQQMQQMQSTIERQERLIEKLESRQAGTPPPSKPAGVGTSGSADALDRALAEAKTASPAPSTSPGLVSRPVGPATLRLIDVSFDVLLAGGTSTAEDDEIANLQAGGHDPHRRGFTLQQAELSLAGAVDPYFNGEAHLVFGEDHVEIEEGFLTTTSLPYGLQVEAGQFLTEFGRINPTHSHAWSWIDQPVILSRVFGGEGLRNPGVRVGWLLPVPWFSELHLGAQNAQGETAVSFLSEDGIGGRPVVNRTVRGLGDLLYLTRWENAWDLGSTVTAKLGASALFGPNNTGSDGRTRIDGVDLVVKWRPTDNQRGWPFLSWDTEVVERAFDADRSVSGPRMFSAATLHDWGLYSQLLYGFRPGWATGVRYEFVTGSGASIGGTANDPFRDTRHRFAPLLIWQPSEFSRLRLQYDFDHAEHLRGDAHTLWFGVEILYGSHAAHKY